MADSKLLIKAKEMLKEAKGQCFSVKERSSKAVELAGWLLTESRDGLKSSERNTQAQLAGMMQDTSGKHFTTDMTDQCFRTQRDGRIADQMVYLLRRHGIPKFLPFESRFKLFAFRWLAPFFPQLLVPAATYMLRREMRKVIAPGEEERLHRYLKKKSKEQVRVNLNHIGEAVLGEEEAKRRLAIYLRSLADPHIEYISVKVSSIFSQIHLVGWEHSLQCLKERLRALYRQGKKHTFRREGGEEVPKFINLDMEEYRDLPLTLELFRSVLDEPEFFDYSAGIVLQAYLPDAYLQQQDLTVWAMKRVANGGAPIKIRLVKGANLMMERVESSSAHWPQAPYGTKMEVDGNFKRMLEYGCEPDHARAAHIGVGSHNLFDIAYALLLREERGVQEEVEFEMLEGMADHMRRVIQEVSGEMLLYCPAARKREFVNAVSYLIRRLDENTAEENFLRHSFDLEPGSVEWENQVTHFLRSCELIPGLSSAPRRKQNPYALPQPLDPHAPFSNAPHMDWALPRNREWAQELLRQGAQKDFGSIPIVVGGVELQSEAQKKQGRDPSQPSAIPYTYTVATEEEGNRALEIGVSARPTWQAVKDEERVQIMQRAAQLIRERRKELTEALICDGGKVIQEALAEVEEAIDFAEYYWRSLLKWKGEEGLIWEPLGTVLVASPWNFPFAIPFGGVCAALLGGNTVIFKPAQETVLVAWKLVQLFWDAGVPKEVLQFLVCEDEPVGSLLVSHESVSAVVLTGASETAEKLLGLRPQMNLMAETGGKNSLIITAMADRDLAIKDLLTSAFGHSGQKCSAASLAILEAEVYDDPSFLKALRDGAASLVVGSAWDPATRVGPLIAAPGEKLYRGLTELEEGEEWLLKPKQHASHPQLWSPGIKMGVKPQSFTQQIELFGPVLGLMRARHLDEAIALANQTEYGLTAGIHTLDVREQEKWKKKIVAGNGYINRTTTGAIVGRQPFGGLKKSCYGSGAKAGGENYLTQMMAVKESSLPQEKGELDGALSLFLEGAEKVGVQGKEGSPLYHALKSYALESKARLEQFRDVSGVLGEDNLFYYTVRERQYLYVGGEEELEQALCVMGAALTVKAPWTFLLSSSLKERLAGAFPQKGRGEQIQFQVLEEEQLLSFFASEKRVSAIRFFQDPPQWFLEVLSQKSLQARISPPSLYGKIELLHHLNERSLSVAYHRYGNLGEREGSWGEEEPSQASS